MKGLLFLHRVQLALTEASALFLGTDAPLVGQDGLWSLGPEAKEQRLAGSPLRPSLAP